MILSVDPNAPMTRDSVLSDNCLQALGTGGWNNHLPHRKGNARRPSCTPRATRHQKQAEERTGQDGRNGIIKKVTIPTDWVNSLVVVEKANCKLMICLDPKDLNAAVKRPHYPMPTLEDSLSKSASARFFSKLDVKSDYWQLKLTEQSSYLPLLTRPLAASATDSTDFPLDSSAPIITSNGRWMKSLKASLESHRSLMISSLAQPGRTMMQTPKQLAQVKSSTLATLSLLRGWSLTQPKWMQSMICLLMWQKGTPELAMQCMIIYLAKFAAQLSETIKPMRDILRKMPSSSGMNDSRLHYKKIIDPITSQQVLAFFDPKKEVRLEVDASEFRLGASTFQGDKPVVTRQNPWPQQSKTTSARCPREVRDYILFGCRKFHQYIYGREITVHSNHKPLESITKKPLAAAPPRLLHMLLQLQKCNLKIVHAPGKASQSPTLCPGSTFQLSLQMTSMNTSTSSSMQPSGTYL